MNSEQEQQSDKDVQVNVLDGNNIWQPFHMLKSLLEQHAPAFTRNHEYADKIERNQPYLLKGTDAYTFGLFYEFIHGGSFEILESNDSTALVYTKAWVLGHKFRAIGFQNRVMSLLHALFFPGGVARSQVGPELVDICYTQVQGETNLHDIISDILVRYWGCDSLNTVIDCDHSNRDHWNNIWRSHPRLSEDLIFRTNVVQSGRVDFRDAHEYFESETDSDGDGDEEME